jgi:hypothetical protein
VSTQGTSQIALGTQHIPNLSMACAQALQPFRVGRIDRHQSFPHRLRLRVDARRPGQIALGTQQVANLLMASAQVLLVLHVEGISRRQTLIYR